MKLGAGHDCSLMNYHNVIYNFKTYCRFSDSHEFEKPNDVNALRLMNRCAEEVMKEFQDLILSYGQSDEYR